MSTEHALSRRNLMSTATTLGLTLPAIGLSRALAANGSSAPPPQINNPDEAVDALMKGNQRFIDGAVDTHDHQAAQQRGASGQSPFAAFIRCADSRVAPEIVFDQTIGELFICGVAGNIPTPEIIASLEFSVAVLKSSLVVVMGHSKCGAVEAAITHEDDVMALPGGLPNLVSEILPASMASRGAEDRLAAAIEINVRNGVKQVTKESTVIAEAVDAGQCKVVGGVYDLASGRFTLVE